MENGKWFTRQKALLKLKHLYLQVEPWVGLHHLRAKRIFLAKEEVIVLHVMELFIKIGKLPLLE